MESLEHSHYSVNTQLFSEHSVSIHYTIKPHLDLGLLVGKGSSTGDQVSGSCACIGLDHSQELEVAEHSPQFTNVVHLRMKEKTHPTRNSQHLGCKQNLLILQHSNRDTKCSSSKSPHGSCSVRRCRGRLMLLRPEGRPTAFHWEQQGCTWRDGKLESNEMKREKL